jgi:large subunit ribosomal protein L29
MKSTKFSDLSNLTEKELKNQVEQNERAMVDMRFKQAVGQLESTAVLRTIRRDAARMRTLLRQRELAGKGAK